MQRAPMPRYPTLRIITAFALVQAFCFCLVIHRPGYALLAIAGYCLVVYYAFKAIKPNTPS